MIINQKEKETALYILRVLAENKFDQNLLDLFKKFGIDISIDPINQNAIILKPDFNRELRERKKVINTFYNSISGVLEGPIKNYLEEILFPGEIIRGRMTKIRLRPEDQEYFAAAPAAERAAAPAAPEDQAAGTDPAAPPTEYSILDKIERYNFPVVTAKIDGPAFSWKCPYCKTIISGSKESNNIFQKIKINDSILYLKQCGKSDCYYFLKEDQANNE